MRVADKYGGRRCYLPGVATLECARGRENWLAKLVGMDAALKIATACAPRRGIQVDVPFGPTSRRHKFLQEIDRLLNEGSTAYAVARNLNCDRRTVQRRLTVLRGKIHQKQT